MEILFLKALREKNFDHRLQQISLFFTDELDKFKLQTQLEILTHITDEKQVGIKVSEHNLSLTALVARARRLA